MKQRSFPWISGVSQPTDAPRQAVIACADYGMAARVALEMKPGGPWTDAWLAARLGVSRGYLSRVLAGKQPMPEWMLRPIAFATGSRLILQFHAVQEALREEADPRAEIRRIARQAMDRMSHADRRQEARAA